ncbi:MAG: hypothetical protein JWP69_2241 [Flaviaesturariibacter sp.]|nr:hypothetical protein [Flaviaesturariibacter sp.]
MHNSKYFFGVIKTILLLLISATVYSQTKKGTIVSNGVQKQGKTYALIIGVADYHQLPKLDYAPADALAFQDYLLKDQKLPKENVFCFTNETATYINIFDKLYLINDSLQPGDCFIFYFSGHGDWESKISDNSLLLLSKAPAKNYLRYPDQYLDCQKINEFIKRISERDIKAVLIADACHSGNLSGGTAGAETTNLQLKKGWKNEIRILSCMPDEVSFEDKRWGGGRGVFSYYLTEGLKGMTRKEAGEGFDLTMG